MSETQGLLDRIAALRKRLELGQGKVREAGGNGQDDSGATGLARLWELEREVSAGADQTRALDNLPRVAVPMVPAQRTTGPTQLTARARKVLEKGRELLQAIKTFHAEPVFHEPGLLATLYRQATVLAESALRLVTQLPDSPNGQMQMCEGIEALLGCVAQRLGTLALALQQHREEEHRLALLADFYDRLEAGAPVDITVLSELSETLLNEASESGALRFHYAPRPVAERTWVVRFVAAHSLTVAQVMARLTRHEPELKNRAVEAVLGALLHDVGMLRVPPELLAQTDPLGDEGRREVERHCQAGGELVKRLLPDASWLVDAVEHHHERLDGTGYPDGLKESQLSPLVRLLAVCDVYAAGCLSRPHRPARDTRTALTDALLLAEQGKLDRHFAERLLHLSFYPVGSVVEMADGTLAGVIAASANERDLHAPARPIVALLTDSQGHLLPAPHYLDLSHSASHSIVRTLALEERRRHLGMRYPEWAL